MNVHLFAVTLCLMVYFESIGNMGITSASVSLKEKQFFYSSSISGLMATMYDIAFSIFTLPISYMAGRKFKKPLWCAAGVFLIALSFFLFTLPTFLSGKYKIITSRENNVCQSARNASYCDYSRNKVTESPYIFLFYIAFFILGIGNIPQNTVAVEYIEENSGLGGFYFGMMQAIRSAGAITGAMLTSFLLKIPVNLSPLPVDQSSSLWVGAYWIGYLCTGIVLVFFVLLLSCFPRTFASCNAAEDKQSEGFFGTLKSLLSNLPFVFINLTSVSESLVLAGLLQFQVKYFIVALGFSSSKASSYLAFLIFSGFLGSLIGGIFSKIYKNSFSKLIKLLIFASVIQIIAANYLLFKCNQTPVAGIFVDYHGKTTSHVDFHSHCNQDCSCSAEFFQPVCDTQTKTSYLNGCFAGCGRELQNCTCTSSMISNDLCDSDCSPARIWLNISLAFIFVLCMACKVPLGIAASITTIKVSHTSVAMAIINLAQRLFGMTPGPIIIGVIFDICCDLWQNSCNNSNGSCLLTNVDLLTFYLYILLMICCLFPLFFYILAFYIQKNTKKNCEILAVMTSKI